MFNMLRTLAALIFGLSLAGHGLASRKSKDFFEDNAELSNFGKDDQRTFAYHESPYAKDFPSWFDDNGPVARANDDDVYAACGTTRSCFANSDSCVDSKNCEYLLSYGAQDETNGKMPMDLYGKAHKSKYSNKFWIGFGVNPSDTMAHTAVVQCARYPNGSGEVLAGYNPKKHCYKTLDQRQLGISDVAVKFQDSYQRCSFNLDVQRNISGNIFDLNRAYRLMVCSGKVCDDDSNDDDCDDDFGYKYEDCDDVGHHHDDDCVYSHCGKTRQCYGVPDGCVEKKNCTQLVAYEKARDGRIPFELYGGPPSADYKKNFWVGFGASASGGMDDSAVVQCAHFADGKSEVVAAYNAANHTYVPLKKKHEGIHREGAVFHDGFIRCTFELDVVRNISGEAFDLQTPYFLLLGSGWVNHTSKHHYELKWHLQKPLISSQKIVFACGPKCKNSTGLATAAPPVPPRTRPTSAPEMSTGNPGQIVDDVYVHCGLSRRCFGVPVGCIQGKNCTQLLSYGQVDGRKIPVDLYGTAPDAKYVDNFWIGFGASNSGGMDDTAVVQCARYSNGNADVVAAYNALNHTYQPLQDRHSGITGVSAQISNGYVQCSFNLDIRRTVAGKRFDLSTPYFILVGSGWINETEDDTYELKWHLQKPLATATKVVMSCGNACPPSDEEGELTEPFVDDVYTQCDKQRRCFGFPDGCVATKNCTSLLAYGAEHKKHIPVEMYGTAPNSTYKDDFWIGFGASMSGGMDLSEVVQCAHYFNGTNDVVGAFNALNHTYQSLPNRHAGIIARRAKFENGFLRCGFRLAVERNVSGYLFNLSTPYTVLVAYGWINETADNIYELKWHLAKPYISPSKVNMSCGNECPSHGLSEEFSGPYDKCGVVRKCYGVPAGCVAQKNCLQLLTYAAQFKEQMEMLLYGTAPDTKYQNDFWVGFGASSSGGMDWSAVVQCGYFDNGKTDVVAAQNVGNHTYQPLQDRHNGISAIRSGYSNGFVQCRFTLDVARNVTGNIYDLNNPYYLLLGSGWVNQTASNTYDFKWHLVKPYVSPEKIVFACGNCCPNTTTSAAVPTRTTLKPTVPVTVGEPSIDQQAVNKADPTSTTADFTTSTSVGPTQYPYMCGGDMQCYGVPEGCIEKQNCQQMLMYRYVADGMSGKLRVALVGTYPDPKYSENFWVGFAASASGGMDDAAVVQCARYGNGTVDVVAAYNALNHTYQPLEDKHLGISDNVPQYDNGYVSCSFYLDIVRNVSSHVYNLTNPYTLLIGSGWINATGDNAYELKWHEKIPWKSPLKIIMAQEVATTTAASTTTVSPDDIYTQCGKSRKCLGTPDQDCVEKKNCEQLLSYGGSNNSDMIPVELYGRNTKSPTGFWIGLGMSMSGQMASAAVVMCTTNGTEQPQIVTGYNVDGQNAHDFKPDNSSGIHQGAAWIIDGYARCTFSLSLKRMVSGHLFDLNTPYTLLLGTGPMKSGFPRYHSKDRTIFSKAVMACGNRCPPSPCTNATCFGVPAGCEEIGGCTALVAWSAVPNENRTDEDAGVVQVGIYGIAPQDVPADAYWIGFGVSHGRSMDHTAVVQCVVRPNGTNEVIAAYNPKDHEYEMLSNTSYGIHKPSINTTDGGLQCEFQLDVVREMPGNNTFDLRELMYVLLGSGPLHNDTLTPRMHKKIPRVSHTEYKMACETNCSFTPTTTTPPTTTTMIPNTKERFGLPAGCEQNEDTCMILSTFSTSETNRERVAITLEGRPDAAGDHFWLAFGIAPGAAMDNAMVVECVHWTDGKDEKNDVFASYNDDKHDNFRTAMDGVYVNSTSLDNGKLKCALEIDVVRTVDPLGKFDLNNPYYLLLAEGLTMKESNDKIKHVRKSISSGTVVVNSTGGGDVTTAEPPSTTTAKPNDKGRFGYPAGCEKEEDKCQIISKFSTSETHNQRVAITLEGRPDASGDSFWIAFGIASGAAMGNAMVVECVHWTDGKEEKNDVFASYNDDKPDNIRMTPMTGVYVNSTALENGKLKCSMEVDVIRNVETLGTFNLSNPYYLLLAEGLTVKGTSDKIKHVHKIYSSGKVVVNSTTGGDVPSGKDKTVLKKLHACLMVFAWNFCAAMGIFFARQTKNMLPEKMPFGLKMWFHFHRGHMITAVLAAVAAAIIIFVDKAQWLNIAHTYTGFISLLLAFVQPIIATFRPHPGTPKRRYFNYTHWSIGYSALLLAGVTMFLGTRLEALGVPEYVGYLIIGSYAWNLILQLLLETHKARQARLRCTPSCEQVMTDDGVVLTKSGEDTCEPLDPEDGVRKIILGLTYVGVFGFTVAIIVLIATS